MPSLRTHALVCPHARVLSAQPIDLHLAPGWTGLVAANGAGKTTLLKMLAGTLAPADGRVIRDPSDLSLVTCPQSVEHPDPAIARLALADDRNSVRLRATLRLAPDPRTHWPTLSPGERKRWQIGGALASAPDILLLDEPTNHLDDEARALLLAALRRFDGIGLVVSHDRALLDRLTTRTLRIHHGALRSWPGPYSVARPAWEAERAAHNAEHAALTGHQRALGRRLGDLRRDHASADNQRSASRRMKNIHDQDASSMMANFTVDKAAARLGRAVHVARDGLERATLALEHSHHEAERGASVVLTGERAPMPYVLAVDLPELRAGSQRLLGPVRLALARDARVHLRGRNGVGKTTLLRALLAGARCPPGRILEVPQDMSEETCRALLADLRRSDAGERGRVLSRVDALGVDPGALLASPCPSPGEARKLLLAQGLARGAWCLVLDEPSNHLDLPAIERLEAALADYPGALLLVSHDPVLAGRLTTTTWEIADHTLTVRLNDAWLRRGQRSPGQPARQQICAPAGKLVRRRRSALELRVDHKPRRHQPRRHLGGVDEVPVEAHRLAPPFMHAPRAPGRKPLGRDMHTQQQRPTCPDHPSHLSIR